MNNNIDISLTLGTRADMSGINQVRKGVDDLSTAARGLPRELISGGVGTVADARAFSGASAPGKMTIQVEGLDRLAGTIARAEGVAASGLSSQGQTDKALEEMQAGIARVGAKKVSAQLADVLAKGKAKVEAWQAGMSAELGRLNQEQALKKEHSLVKQINDAYDARKRTIEALDEKASRNLEMQAQLLAIENEKNRSIIRQKQIRGEMTESQARDALAAIDAKDAGERREIERKQAENAVKKAEALAEAKAEQIRRMQELTQSSPAAAGVRDLKTEDFYKQADAFKNAEAALKQWQELAARQKKLKKEIADAPQEMAKAAMLGGVGIPLVAGLMQKKAQDEESLKHVTSLMDSMRKDARMPEAANGEMMARLIADKQQQEAALNNMMDGIKNTGLLGDVRGKSGDALYMAYADSLKIAREVIKNRTASLADLIKEQEALDDSVKVAKERLNNVLTVQGVQEKADLNVQEETKKTDAWQDNQRRDATVHSESNSARLPLPSSANPCLPGHLPARGHSA